MSAFAELVGASAAFLPEALVSRENLAAIEAAVARLPCVASEGLGVECRLSVSSRWSDFYFPPSRTRDAAVEIPAALRAHPVWERLAAFWRAWGAPGTPLHERVRDLWLEFDVEEAGRLPVPVVFYGPGPVDGDPVEVARWALANASPVLLGAPVGERVVRRVLDCAAALPAGARVDQIGSLLARGSDTLRVCLGEFPPREVEGYLRRVGCDDPTGRRAALLDSYADLLPKVTLDLDVSDAVGPAVGLEFSYFADAARDGATARCAPLLERLTEAGACLAEKRAAVLAWLGVAPVFTGMRMTGLLVRRLSHVKLAWHPERPIEAKAYLASYLVVPGS